MKNADFQPHPLESDFVGLGRAQASTLSSSPGDHADGAASHLEGLYQSQDFPWWLALGETTGFRVTSSYYKRNLNGFLSLFLDPQR